MKKSAILISTLFLLISVISINLFAQKDTTEINFGKRKLLILENDLKKSKDIDNLKEGIKTFENEIEKTSKESEALKSEIEGMKKELETLNSEKEKQKKMEEISKKEAQISENDKKIESFKKGTLEIESGIEKMKKELENENNSDDSEGNCKNHIKKFDAHLAGIELGFSNFINNNSSLASDQEMGFMQLKPEKSFNLSLNIFEVGFPIIAKNLGVSTALSLEWNRYALEQNIDILTDENNILKPITIDENIIKYNKNYLNSTYLNVPVIMEFQKQLGSKQIYISAGAFGGVRLTSRQKQVFDSNGDKNKIKNKDDFEMSPFKYGLTARIGYGPISLFANYSMNTLFKNNAGPELYPITVGLRLINF